MLLRKVLLAILFTAGILDAGTIARWTSCTLSGMGTVSGAANCSEAASNGTSASAYSIATYSIGGNQVNADFAQMVFVRYEGRTVPGGSAAASGNINLALSTPGPVRDGYLELYVTSSGVDRYLGEGELSVQVGSYSASCSIIDVFGCNGILPSESSAAANPIPFTLGETFMFSAGLSSSTFCGWIDGECYFGFGTGGSVPVYAQFFESDGVTPVAVSDPVTVPEPASAWMGLVALALILCIKLTASVVRAARR